MMQLMDMALNVKNADGLTDNLNMASAACYEAIAMWINYENID